MLETIQGLSRSTITNPCSSSSVSASIISVDTLGIQSLYLSFPAVLFHRIATYSQLLLYSPGSACSSAVMASHALHLNTRSPAALSRPLAQATTCPCINIRHRGSSWAAVQHNVQQQQLYIPRASSSADNPEVSMEELFAAELATRAATEAKQAEVAAAAVFDGPALLALLRKKYGRSYDVSLVQRTYLGKVFVALNIMWKYMEQQSFSYSEEQYMQRLEYVAAALVSWGAVTTVQSQLAATKERPRVGKAVSIMLDVPQERAREWIAG